mmetsp:Transcript_12713/g.21558  ORF Transcript_12713/g.21558 Transcript_12713/m.21558 type:complete len:186 (+) Transcript_12713:69-626(+)|eukprot:CAMPEP_0198211328 /NCGR_PEP_ID=MMETSP1445-20131203/23193_1 /TAXON_ID=36898 /ORGANISM="Pyramimonas sp., Strain CCMP2087" /LENGTH=185 /DNA_ID=CAMNT_0043885561 /DNA_START=69 /DNA_END=626 /DNA_ORIENTATION=+
MLTSVSKVCGATIVTQSRPASQSRARAHRRTHTCKVIASATEAHSGKSRFSRRDFASSVSFALLSVISPAAEEAKAGEVAPSNPFFFTRPVNAATTGQVIPNKTLVTMNRNDLVVLIEREREQHSSTIGTLAAQNEALFKEQAQLELRLAQYQTQLRDYVQVRAKVKDLDSRVQESKELLQDLKK